MTAPGRIDFPLLKRLSGAYKKIPEKERNIFQSALLHIITVIVVQIREQYPEMLLEDIMKTWTIKYIEKYF